MYVEGVKTQAIVMGNDAVTHCHMVTDKTCQCGGPSSHNTHQTVLNQFRPIVHKTPDYNGDIFLTYKAISRKYLKKKCWSEINNSPMKKNFQSRILSFLSNFQKYHTTIVKNSRHERVNHFIPRASKKALSLTLFESGSYMCWWYS